jgi:hypothetical protein
MATMRSEDKNAGKRIAIVALFAVSVLIVLSGVAFGAYSWINQVSYSIMSMDVPGVVFAAVVVFLGARYFRSVQKMKAALEKSTHGFSWKNFKIGRTKKMEG